MINETAEFQTTDFHLATYLYVKGVRLLNVIPQPGNVTRKVFLFAEPPAELLINYQTGKAEANLMAITKAQDFLRDLVRSS